MTDHAPEIRLLTEASALIPGQYYEMHAPADPHIPAGELVLVTKLESQTVHFACGAATYHMPAEAFRRSFRFAPDGAARRQAAIGALMQEVQQAGHQVTQLAGQLAHFNPHVGSTGVLETGMDAPLLLTDGEARTTSDEGPQEPGPTPMSLVAPAGASLTPEALKQQVAGVRQLLASTKREMAQRQQRLQALLAEQQAVLAAAMAGLEAHLETARAQLWTINLYLGRDEEIVQIADGAPAPEDARIAVRQLVLYADEESAIAADDGGIDIRLLDELDQWLAVPAHRDQVLPNPKGVVAFKLRRNERDYGDPWANNALNKENLRTYFLFRNGERLYRMTTDFAVGATLLPLDDEFEALFHAPNVWGERSARGRALTPGSDAYMQALKRADAKIQHYMRVMLILQGVADRTPLWHPLPAARMNFFDVRQHGVTVDLVMDAERSRMLGSGRPPFREWLRDVNAQLDVGHRIVGAFSNRSFGVGKDWSRVRPWQTPRHRSGERPTVDGIYLPLDTEIHTIAQRDGDDFIIRYDRRDEIYVRGEGFVTPKTRASCRVFRTDLMLLDIDAATIEDMEYYLTSRLQENREQYLFLVPVLKRAIRAKRAEAAAEAPFHALLVGQIMQAHGATHADAEAGVAELVRWYKFATRTHRALTTDDQKALRMIVAEYGQRVKRTAERMASDDTAIVAALRDAAPAAVLIGHKTGRDYVVLVPENAEQIFVREQTWRAAGDGAVSLVKESRWKLVDARHERWAARYTSDRWATWQINARPGAVLTDPEREALLATAFARLEQKTRIEAEWRGTAEEACFRPLAVTVDAIDHKLTVWYCDQQARVPGHGLLSSSIREPGFAGAHLVWTRSRRGVQLTDLDVHHYVFAPHWEPTTEDPYHHGGRGAKATIWIDRDAIAWLETEWTRMHTAERERRRLERKLDRFWRAGTAIAEAMATAEAKQKFLEDGHEEHEWPAHRERLPIPVPYADRVRRSATHLIERGIAVAGRTLGDIERAAALFGYVRPDDARDAHLPDECVIMTVEAWDAYEAAEAARQLAASSDDRDATDVPDDDAAEAADEFPKSPDDGTPPDAADLEATDMILVGGDDA